MNRTGESGRFEADERRIQMLTEITEQIIRGPDTMEMADGGIKISRMTERMIRKLWIKDKENHPGREEI